ncbi:MAG: hypothetical protein OXC38_01765 [Gammaproteobacteria bacterium]|nr:hypothetical protein [Gammaproteobacteria bacterium]
MRLTDLKGIAMSNKLTPGELISLGILMVTLAGGGYALHSEIAQVRHELGQVRLELSEKVDFKSNQVRHELSEKIDSKFNQVRLELGQTRLELSEKIDSKSNQVRLELGEKIDSKFNQLDAKIGEVNHRMGDLQERVATLETLARVQAPGASAGD